MKKTIDSPIPFLLAISLLLAGPAALRAADLPTVRYQGQPTNCTLEIQGTSTFHDWEMKGTTIGGILDLLDSLLFNAPLMYLYLRHVLT